MRAIARIRPGETELRANPRSRSAILRVAERTDVGIDVGMNVGKAA
jgi:16S rRNA (cytosine1402-N4)-methyltransferase